MASVAHKLPDPIATLRNEHRYMGLLLDTMLQRLRERSLNSHADYYLVQDIARYLHEYPDAVHHPTEDSLFRRLVERDPSSAIDVARLRRDHERLESATTDIIDLLDVAFEDQRQATIDAACAAIEAYIADLKKHMHYEETMLFPKAVECLAKSDWNIVDNELRKIDDPLFGGTVGTEFRPLFEYFARRSDNLSRSVATFEFEQLDAMIVRADAIERFLSDMWELSSMFADASLSELRGALDRITTEPGARSLLATPLRLTLFFGIQSIGYGGAAATITKRTIRRLLRPSSAP